jgi:hypothetical protein
MERGPDTSGDRAMANDEPALTQTNSDTVVAEDELVDDHRERRGGDETPVKP